jgi:prevent-host-death family protein
MKEISISEFSKNCSLLIERVRKTKQPILVTRRGVAVAEVVPCSSVKHRFSSVKDRSAWIGSMKDSMEILGDIVSPPNEQE